MITENSVASEEIVINAPAEIVWGVLMDFANYELWNSFCPRMKGEPVVGSALEMQVDLGNGLQAAGRVRDAIGALPYHRLVHGKQARRPCPRRSHAANNTHQRVKLSLLEHRRIQWGVCACDDGGHG